MKTRFLRGLLVISLLASVNLAWAQGTAFTCHGQLNGNGSPADGSYDLTFSVFDADTGTNQIGATVTNTALHVVSGLFTATLDFGDGIFTGIVWMEIPRRSRAGFRRTALQ